MLVGTPSTEALSFPSFSGLFSNRNEPYYTKNQVYGFGALSLGICGFLSYKCWNLRKRLKSLENGRRKSISPVSGTMAVYTAGQQRGMSASSTAESTVESRLQEMDEQNTFSANTMLAYAAEAQFLRYGFRNANPQAYATAQATCSEQMRVMGIQGQNITMYEETLRQVVGPANTRKPLPRPVLANRQITN